MPDLPPRRRRLPPIVQPAEEMAQDEKIVALQREELMLSAYRGRDGQSKLEARLVEIRQAVRRLMYPGSDDA